MCHYEGVEMDSSTQGVQKWSCGGGMVVVLTMAGMVRLEVVCVCERECVCVRERE